MGWWNPFDLLGEGAAKLIADAWTVAMLGIWGAGLYFTRILMALVDLVTNPDLSADGPAREIYQYTFGIALLLAMILLALQLGRAALRRDGRSLGQAVWGAVQFQGAGLLWVLWCVVVFGGASGLAATFRRTLLGVDSWRAFQPFAPFEAQDVSDGVVATVLGMMGLLMVVAALMHFVVLLVAAASALVIAVTGIIAAAGLTNESTSRWFWMTLRWFHAAALTPVVVVLMLGLAIQISQGVVLEDGDSMSQDISAALIGIILICISVFSPLALFKLLAFVDPGTNSGAALRTAMQSSNPQRSGSDAASRVDSQGRSVGERAGEAETTARIGQAQAGAGAGGGAASAGAGGGAAAGGRLAAAGGALGVVGAGAGVLVGGGVALLQGMRTIGAQGAVVGADIANQGGIGHNTYVPDYREAPRRQQQAQPDVNQAQSDTGSGPDHQVPHLNARPAPTPPAGGGGAPGGGAPGGGVPAPPGGASVPTPPKP